MDITSHAITTTTVAGTTYSTISLTADEVANAQWVAETGGEEGLRVATRSGLFSPVTAGPADTVAAEIKADSSAVIVVVAETGRTTTTVLSENANSSS